MRVAIEYNHTIEIRAIANGQQVKYNALINIQQFQMISRKKMAIEPVVVPSVHRRIMLISYCTTGRRKLSRFH